MLSLDEQTQIQTPDRTQPLLPIEFDASEQRIHDYVRQGTPVHPHHPRRSASAVVYERT